MDEHPLVRNRSRHTSSGSTESTREVGVIEASPPSSPRQNNISSHPQHNGNVFHSDEVSFYLNSFETTRLDCQKFFKKILVRCSRAN